MPSLVIGSNGCLGQALLKILPDAIASTHQDFDLEYSDPAILPDCHTAYLCAGTKGFRECEGNPAAFRADVDGNLRVIRYLHKKNTFIVFVSTNAVEWAPQTAYARNRWAVETILALLPNTAVIRASKFNTDTAPNLATLCATIGQNKQEGLHHWQ